MAMVVWKFPVDAEAFTYPIPANAQILSVAMQHGNPVLYALVNDEAPKQPRSFLTVGTGHPLPPSHTYHFHGTFEPEPGLWFHLFEVID